MNTGLSSPRLGDRGFDTLDDPNNWGLHKRALGEVDVFQIDATHELYGHMNVTYLQVPPTPSFDDWAATLSAISTGKYFTTTGKLLMARTAIEAKADLLTVNVAADWTFPLRMAEIVWG